MRNKDTGELSICIFTKNKLTFLKQIVYLKNKLSDS